MTASCLRNRLSALLRGIFKVSILYDVVKTSFALIIRLAMV